MGYLFMILERTFEMLSFSIKRFLFLILVNLCGLILIIATLYFNESYWYFQRETNRAFGKNTDNICSITIHGLGDEDLLLYDLVTNNSDIIEAIGDVRFSGNYNLYELIKIKNKKTNKKDKYIDTCYVTKYSQYLTNIELLYGEYQDIDDENCYGVYLGYDYRSVPVGTVYNMTPKGNVKCVVLGIMKKGTCIPNTTAIGNMEVSEEPCVNVDSFAIFIEPEIKNSYPMFLKYKDCTFNDVRQELNEKASLYGCTVDVTPIGNLFKMYNNSNKIYVRSLWKLVYTVLTVVIMLLISTQIVAMIKNKGRYGVFIISGLNKRDIVCMIIIENIIRYVMVILICLGLLTFYYKSGVIPSNRIAFNPNVIYRYVIGKAFAIEMLILLIPTVIMCVLVKEMNPVVFLEDDK